MLKIKGKAWVNYGFKKKKMKSWGEDDTRQKRSEQFLILVSWREVGQLWMLKDKVHPIYREWEKKYWR